LDVGASVMHDFFAELSDFKFERPIQRSERQLFAIVAPTPKKP
jgi:hypothetical protein